MLDKETQNDESEKKKRMSGESLLEPLVIFPNMSMMSQLWEKIKRILGCDWKNKRKRAVK